MFTNIFTISANQKWHTQAVTFWTHEVSDVFDITCVRVLFAMLGSHTWFSKLTCCLFLEQRRPPKSANLLHDTPSQDLQKTQNYVVLFGERLGIRR